MSLFLKEGIVCFRNTPKLAICFLNDKSHINQSVFQYIFSIFHKLPVKSDNAEFISIAKNYNISEKIIQPIKLFLYKI